MSYTNLLYHLIIRTKGSAFAITEAHETDLYRYIHGFVQHKGGILYRIGGMPDHLHLLVKIPPMIALSDFVRTLKISTNHFLTSHSELFPSFSGWSRSYAAFTYSLKEREVVKNYIANQKAHHAKSSFSEELYQLLLEEQVSFDANYFLRD